MSWWSFRRRNKTPDHDPVSRAIRFDTDGWDFVASLDEGLEWRDDLGNQLRVSFLPRPAEHVGEPSDIKALRAFWRRETDAREGAIVEVEYINIAGIRCLKAITKYERRPSYDYEGTITIPLGNWHFAIVMKATEHGTTGVREAVVANELVRTGELDLSGLKVPE